MTHHKQTSPYYNGVKFIDIDDGVDLPTDFEIERIPNKGDIISFNISHDNKTIYHHCVVLYIVDNRSSIMHSAKSFEDMEIDSCSIYVVTKTIKPELGEKTWKSIYDLTK